MHVYAAESAQAWSPDIVSKSSANTKHLTWSHTLREQTNRKKSSVLAPCEQSECNKCSPHKCATSQFIDRISYFMNEGNILKHLNESKVKGSLSVASSLATMNPSCHASETDDTLSLNHPSAHHKLVSLSAIPTVKGSSTTTSLQDVDEASIHRTNGRSFPTCYHPISSIAFQCKEMKVHLKKHSVPYKIVLGIEYNLNRLSMDLLAGKGTDRCTLPDADSEQSIVQQVGRLKELKTICKSLKEEKKALEDEVNAQREAASLWKSKQNDFNLAVANLKSQLEESVRKAEDYGKALTNSAQLMAELQEENKSLPLLRTMVAKHNEHMKGVVRENELMRLEVQKMRLERETFKMLLQNKDIEIQKFGEEIKAIQQAATDQFAHLQSVNQEHILHHRLGSRSRYPATFSSSEQGTPRSRSHSETRDRSLQSSDKHNEGWEGGGESAIFPICSSPSSENNSLSLGPSQSWNQISPITSDLNQASSFPRYMEASQAIWTKDNSNKKLEQGPYTMSENTLQRLQFLKMDVTHSSLELSHMQGQVMSVSHRQPQASDSSKQGPEVVNQKQTNAVPNRPKAFLDLMPPPSELSQWTDSCEDVSFQ